jgi:hypothetical protein
MTQAKVLLAPTTAAATAEFDAITHSIEFNSVDGKADRAVSLFVSGDIGAAEDIAIEYRDGSTWRQCTIEGDDVLLNEGNNIVSLYSPGNFRVNKPITANAVGVLIF